MLALSGLVLAGDFFEGKAVRRTVRFEHLGVAQGLPSSDVVAILQDRTGFMWFGTSNGLVRHDGYELQVFRPSHAGGADPRINCLSEDPQGRLWVGTERAGLFRFDPLTEKFRHYGAPARDESGPSSSSPLEVLSLWSDSDGSVWAGFRNSGLYRYLPAQDALAPVTVDVPGQRDNVWRLYRDRQGVLWAATQSGLLRQERQGGQWTRLRHDPARSDSLANDLVAGLYEDRSGRFWVGTRSGLSLMDRRSRSFRHFRHDRDNSDSIGFGVVADIVEDEEGILWVALLGSDSSGGISRLDPASMTFHTFEPDREDDASLSSFSVYDLQVDRSNVLWAATRRGGISKLDRRASNFYRFRSRGGDPASLGADELTALLQDRTGRLWAGTWGAGLALYQPESDSFRHLRNRPGDPSSLPSDIVLDLLEDGRGRLWVSTWARGLSLLDGSRQSFRPISSAEAPRGRRVIFDLESAPDGSLWLGSSMGLQRFDPSDQSFQDVDCPRAEHGDLTVQALFQGRQGVLWISLMEGLLLSYHDDSGQCRNRTAELGGLEDISAIAQDADGVLWLASRSDGLHRYDPADGSRREFSTAQGLAHVGVMGLRMDRRGHLWLITARGLSHFNPADESFRNLEIAAPLGVNKLNRNPSASGPSGYVYFGGGDGFAAFHPQDLKENTLPPPVVLSGVRVYSGDETLSHRQLMQSPPWAASTLSLKHNQNDLALVFAALDFRAPQLNRYRFRMQGHDSRWRLAGPDRHAVYANLPPGEYRFQVQGANDDGCWNESGTSLTVAVAPPWWHTSWAYALYLLAGVGLLMGAVAARESNQRRQHRRLRGLVAQRTSQLTEQKSLIETQARELQRLDRLKTRFFTYISHEFRTPLSLIIAPLDEILEDGPSLSSNLRRRLKTMRRSGASLLDLVNQMLDLARLQSGRMRLDLRRQDLAACLRRHVQSFDSLAEIRGVTLDFEASPVSISLPFDRDKVEKIAANLLSNALKFTPRGGRVEVRLRRDEQQERVRLQVRDSGPGIAAEDLPRIFDYFRQGGDARQGGSGIGLALSRELALLHGGTLRADSRLGGSTFTLSLPLRPAPGGSQAAKNEEQPGGAERPALGAAAPVTENRADRPGAGASAEGGEPFSQRRPPGDSRQVPAPHESRPGDGQDSFQPASSRLSLHLRSGSATAQETQPSILIVEDNADLRDYLRDCFSRGYHVEASRDGQEALQRARAHPPDLILSDVLMPRMDGHELCRQIKSDPRLSHIPVVLLTARTGDRHKLEGLQGGADDYLFKPFNRRELLTRAENLIRLRRLLARRFRLQSAISEAAETETISENAAFLEKARNTVEECLSDAEFNVKSFASRMALSERHLNRRLQDLMQISAGAFIRMMRLERAAHMLRQKAGSVSQIAYQVGFNDPGYFSRLFRQTFQMTPSEFSSDSASAEEP